MPINFPSRSSSLPASGRGSQENTIETPSRWTNVRRLVQNGLSTLTDAFKPGEVLKSRALRKALRNGENDRARQLLANGANPNLRSRVNWNTALHVAIRTRNTEMAALLITEHHADSTIVDIRGISSEVLAHMNGTFPSLLTAVVRANPEAFTEMQLPIYRPNNSRSNDDDPSPDYDNCLIDMQAIYEPHVTGEKDFYRGNNN
ncbi:MAG: Ankyrin repeat-containing protein [Glomeribacter sp. 1016415]|nr:Ankyrin repeat-containing protein [Glomeribacter sp. 1016415]